MGNKLITRSSPSRTSGYSASDLATASGAGVGVGVGGAGVGGLQQDETVTIVHANVPNSTSEALGVPTLMSRMLEAEELDYSFGQTDSLTDRLNALLLEYADGFAVPKELVQNADDAGATEVRFLYDERTNADAMTCLIDEGMRECHGPALWVYNNATFTDDDFENITKLNGATKESETDKIGRFGLGFNAVYNITDVPSFVSRHNIVIFDPHTTYLGKSIRNRRKPGLRLDMRRHRKKLRSLGNQFKPFQDVFGCDLRKQETYPGTLFRLPLRTRAQAMRSEICRKHYDDREVRELFRLLVQGAESLLLFTQNVLRISIHHLAAGASSPLEMTDVYHVEKRPVRVLRELNPSVLKLSDPVKHLNDETQQFIKQCSVLRSSTEVIRQLRKGANPDRINFPDTSMLIRIESVLSAKGEPLIQLPREHRAQLWLICNCMGRGESLKMALLESYLLPTAGVAVPIASIPGTNGYRPLPIMSPTEPTRPFGAIFAYLPLPVRSGLCVHVNGAFAVASNRRQLCEENEDDKFDIQPRWNAALMSDAVCSAYLRLLADFCTFLMPPSDYEFSELWPNPLIATPICTPLLKSFYRDVASRSPSVTASSSSSSASSTLALFSDGRRWVTVDNVIFLDCAYKEPSLVAASLEVCRQSVVANAAKVAVVLPEWVKRGFQLADNEKVLASRTYDEVEFFEKILLPNIDVISEDDRDLLILNALSKNSAALNRCICENHCIPVTPDGTRLRQSTELVDPQSFIAKLFAPSDARFPFGENTYGRDSVLRLLRGIGMKQNARDLSWDEFVERVQIVGGTTDRKLAQELSAILLSILADKLADNSPSGSLRGVQQQLVELRFIPAMLKPRRFPLHWKGTDDTKEVLFSPAELYPPESKDLVSCVQYIADPNVFPKDSADVLNFLRLGMEWKEPTVTQVLEQLDVISNPDTENYLHDREVAEDIQKMLYSICSFLQQKFMNEAQRQTLREALGNRYFILANNRFLSPKQVALNFTYNCAPYLFALPEHYKRHYSELLTNVGVRSHFDSKDYVYALQSMHDVYLNEALDKESLKLALQLVNLVNERMAEMGQTMREVVSKYGSIYVPDAHNVLRSATELCYNEPDCQWVQSPTPNKTSGASSISGTSSSSVAEGAGGGGGGGGGGAFSHPMIPYAMSKQLGVNTRRQEVLNKHSRGIPFGQKEPLTNRLKRILSGYPCDKEILKELLQNADDAGATEILFIKDPRQHGTDRVFDQSWRPLQGPALCVYNNQPFTEADLEGIQKLGQGSKGMDPNKTGQYGVGFNCVYHLTDTPSFLSKSRELGETLCVFDPHGKYVPGATIEEPGRRYDDVAQLRGIFTDVFPCYLEDKFNFAAGTMFRFPLRTEKMAAESELSDQAVGVEVIDGLFTRFKQEIFDCLLFVNNVGKITLAEVDTRSNGLVNSYTVSIEMSEDERSARREFSEVIKSVAARLQTTKILVSDIPVKEVTYILTLTDSKKSWEKWMVSQRLGVDRNVKIHPGVNEAIRSGELSLLPRGGVAALIDSSDSECNRRQSKVFCFLPLPVKIDLPIHVNGHFTLDHEARRNIWTDEEGGTKTEWNNMLLRHVIAPAYTTLLRRIPPHLSTSMLSPNVSLMDSLAEEVPNLDTYCKLFPPLNRQTPPGYWRNLMEAVYRRIHQQQEPVLPVAKPHNEPFGLASLSHLDASSNSSESGSQVEVEWMSTGSDGIHRPYFDNIKESFRETDPDRAGSRGTTPTRRRRSRSAIRKPSHEVLRYVLLSSGFKLVKLPFEIYESFVEAGVSGVGCVTPRTVIDFYASYGSAAGKAGGASACTLPRLPADIASTPFHNDATLKVVHEYCSQDIPHFRSNLNGLPLLLCEDDQLRQFSSRERVFMSAHHEILPGLNAFFVHRCLVGSIFKEADIDSCDVFKRFDVKAFAGLLQNVLPPAEYYSKPGAHTPTYARWNIDNFDAIPNDRWVFNVWNFLQDEYERTADLQTTPSVGGAKNELNLVRNLLQPIRDWCLLPAQTIKFTGRSPAQRRSSSRTPSMSGSVSEEPIGEHYLVPTRLAETVLDYSQASIMSNPVRMCLSRLGVPELNVSLLDGSAIKKTPGSALTSSQVAGGASFVKLIVATPEQPRTVLKALEYAMIGKHSSSQQQQQQQLSMEDCYTILKYFSDSLDSWEDDLEGRQSLRNIAVHITVHGSIVSLGKSPAYFLHDDVPDTDMDSWQKAAGLILLRQNAQFARLYSVLDCPTLSSTDVYIKYLFKHFDKFSSMGRLAHLLFMRDYKLPQLKKDDKERAIFLEHLRQLQFLSLPEQDDQDGIAAMQRDGRLRKASEFFDPDQPVFKVMLKGKPAAFPATPFGEFSWLEFLRLAGLQTKLSPDHFVKFANEVAERARFNPMDETLFHQSRTLISHLFKMNDLNSSNLLEQIKDIPFVPAAKINAMMNRIYPAYGESLDRTGVTYIRFQDGIPEENEVLVWTSAYLLPTWANPFHLNEHDVSLSTDSDSGADVTEQLIKLRADISSTLGVSEHPSVDLVIEHVQNICSMPLNKSDDTPEMRGFMKMDVMNKIYKFLQSKLAEPGASHDSTLHRALHRLAETPCIVSDLGQTFVKPKQVVINLYEEDQIFPYLFQAPTEQGEYKRLFLHLGATLQSTADQYAAVLESIYQQTGGEKLHPNEMRLAFKAVHGLFTTLQKHRHSDAMAHVHTLYLPTKVGHLFKSTEIIFNDEPAYADRIKHISRPFLVDLAECKIVAVNYEDVVKLLPHRLRPAMLTSVVQEVLEDKSRDSLVLHTVADKLKYQLNSKAFFQGLIRLIKHEHKRSGHRVRQTAVDSIEQHLKKIHVYGVDKLVTYLCYENERIPGSESECQCFVDKKFDEDSGVETWNVCINKTTCLSEELQVSVAESINKIIGGLLKNSVHYIQPILSCVPHSIPKILDRLKIRPDHQHALEQPTLPTSGSLIPIEDHHLLKDDFEEFETGEYVGFEIDDDEAGGPTVIYAVIIERILDDLYESTGRKPSDSEQTHKRLTQQYRINVGEDRPPTIALATDLYKFRRVEGLGRRGSLGGSHTSWSQAGTPSPGPPKSPKPNYRESFYSKSSIFEVDDDGNMSHGERSGSVSGQQLTESECETDFEQSETTPRTPYSESFTFPPSSSSAKRERTESLSSNVELIPVDENTRRYAASHSRTTASAGDQQQQPALSKEEEQRRQELDEVEKTMEEVSDTLEEAWRMPEAQRKKVIKRLLLRWHPDKNIGQEAFSTVITQHIQAELERLELGLPRPTHFDPSQFDFDPRNPFSGSSSFQQNFANAYKFFFEQMNQRAKEHREQRERYQENFSREYNGHGNFDVPPTFSSANPQPAQAKRFLRQAQEDLRAADNDYDAQDPAFEWACFKAHQAAEKALKAAQFAVDAVTSFSHDLAVLAASLEDVELRRLAQKLQKIVGNSNKLYNPDPIDFVVIPHEEYTKEMACDAVMCSLDILERVKEFVELRDSN